MQTIFSSTLNQLITFFLIMIIGFILKKKNIVKDGAENTLSKILALIIAPAMTINTFAENFKPYIIKTDYKIIVFGIICLALSLILAFVLSRFFAKKGITRNIYLYSLAVANYGYFGYPLAEAIFGKIFLFKMMLFCIPLTAFVSSVGYVILVSDKEKISLKRLISPPFIAMLIGAIIGLNNIPLHPSVTKTLTSLSACVGPVSMLLTGIVVAKYPLFKTFVNFKVTLAVIYRLVIAPVILVLIMKPFNLPVEYIRLVLITYALPAGLNTVVYPASKGLDTRTGASMALISNVLCIITLPFIFKLFT